MHGALVLGTSKFKSVNKRVKNTSSQHSQVKPSMKAKKGLVVIPWINGFDKGMWLV